MDNRGSVTDLFLIAIILTATAIMALFGFSIYSSISTSITTSNLNNTQFNETLPGMNAGWATLDNMYLILFLGLCCATLFFAFQVDVHPGWLIFSIGILAFVIVAGVIFSNMYGMIGNNSQMQTYANSFPKMAWVMQNLPLLLLGYGVILLLVMFTKTGGFSRKASEFG